MVLRIQCPYCQNKAAVHERFSGRQLRCPNCERTLTMPAKVDRIPSRSSLITTATPIATPVAVANATPERKGDAHNHEDHDAEHPPTHTPRRQRKKKHGGGEHDEAWDITPMVDVAFLLLIFFMVTASFSIEKVIRTAPEPSDQPSASTARVVQKEEAETVLIQIDEHNGFSVIPHDGDRIETPSRQELLTALKNVRQAADELPQKILIQAHEESTHAAIVAAMDAAREATFSRIDFRVVEELQ